jgi:Protein of unknown function DUF115
VSVAGGIDRLGVESAALDLFARIGRDHAIDQLELGPLEADGRAALPRMWAAYERHWRGFCGSRIDPQFCHLDHPAQLTGAVRAATGAPVVVVGTGPSLTPLLPDLRRLRSALYLFTSPRGADVLAAAGIVPDLVLVEHQTALDAQFSVRDQSHRRSQAIAPLVAADARTPAALLQGVPADRLFVPDPLPTWGLWPATAVCLGLLSGARSVALLGIDLGSRGRPDPLQAPLRDLLGLLAMHTTAACVDIGGSGAAKPHWRGATLDAIATGGAVPPLQLEARARPSAAARHAHTVAAWQRTAPLAADASATLDAAFLVRDGDTSSRSQTRLMDGFTRLLSAGSAVEARIDLQDSLGASFLPRFWRTAPDPTLGAQLWRAAALASHEVVHQHRALGRRLERGA